MAILSLSRGNNAIVDQEDLNVLMAYKWSFNAMGYAVTTVNKRMIYLHRFILNPKENEEVDHINGNGLDNRKSNLRICLHKQNLANRKLNINNTSGYKGITFEMGKWRVRVGGKHIGMFLTIEEAKDEYNHNAIKTFGKFARLNV